MKFKLDENFANRTARLFRDAGYDVQTVREENLQGSSDEKIYEACIEEQRLLVTLDLDFTNVIRFPPNANGGIVVIRVPKNPSLSLLEMLVTQFLEYLKRENPEKAKLFIVEIGRIRIHQGEN